MYLAFLAGFISATKSTLQDATVPLLLAALAGFSWRWAIGVLNNLTKLFTVAQS
jgi:4-hydroxybenzoate polyprenyltransferase